MTFQTKHVCHDLLDIMVLARVTYSSFPQPSGSKILRRLVPTFIRDHELQTVAITKSDSLQLRLRTIHMQSLRWNYHV